jgi:hypothetical protein
MRTVTRDGVGGIFGRSSSVGAPVVGAVTRYNGNQRALPVAGFGADWAPGQPTPDTPTLVAHGYYAGEDLKNNQITSLCAHMPYSWDCNEPNLKLVSIYTGAANLSSMDDFVARVRNGTLPTPPGFPSLVKGATQPPPAPAPAPLPPPVLQPTVIQVSAPSSSLGLFIGLGVAVLALGGAVIAKKKRAA